MQGIQPNVSFPRTPKTISVPVKAHNRIRKLDPRQETFCHEYLKDSNALRSAIRAGYTEKSAGTQAYALLASPVVAARLEQLKQERWRRLQMTSDEVLAHVAVVARWDPRRLYDEKGELLPPDQWPDEVALGVSGIEVDTQIVSRTKAEGDSPETTVRTTTRKVRANDRIRAVELLMRHHNLFASEKKAEAEAFGNALGDALDAARRRMLAARASETQALEQP